VKKSAAAPLLSLVPLCWAVACTPAPNRQQALRHAALTEVISPQGGTVAGTTTGAGAFTGICSDTAGSPEQVYSWTPSASGTAVISTCGASTHFDTVLYVATADDGSGQLSCSDDAVECAGDGDGHGSKVFVQVTAGTTYYIYVDGHDSSGDFGLTVLPPQQADPDPAGPHGLRSWYFSDTDLQTQVVKRIDPAVDFDWGWGSPGDHIPDDNFSSRWVAKVQPRFTGAYKFITESDDGVRLWVNGQLLIDDWVPHGVEQRTGTIDLIAGTQYEVKLEYFDSGGGAVARLSWESTYQQREIIPATRLMPSWPTPPPAADPDPSGPHGLRASYFTDPNLQFLGLERLDANVDFDWGDGSPAPELYQDGFSARWTGQVQPRYTGLYTFTTKTDDGARLWVNGQLVVDQWIDEAPTEWSGTIQLTAGTPYDIKYE
jgi:hypothetical protein